MSAINKLNKINRHLGLSSEIVRGHELNYIDRVFEDTYLTKVDIDKYVYNQAKILNYLLFNDEKIGYTISLLIVSVLSIQNSESIGKSIYGDLEIINESDLSLKEYLFGDKVDTRIAAAKRVVLSVITKGKLIESYEDSLCIEYGHLKIKANLKYREFEELYERRPISTRLITQDIVRLLEDITEVKEYDSAVKYAKECYRVYTSNKDTIIPKYEYIVSLTLAYYLIKLGYTNENLFGVLSGCVAWVDDGTIKIISKDSEFKDMVELGCLD